MGALGKLKSVYYALRYNAWILEGLERDSGQPLKISYAGALPLRNYFIAMAFQGAPKEQSLGKVWVWSLYKRLTGANIGSDLLICDVPRFKSPYFRLTPDLELPVWLRVEINTDVSIESKRKKYSEIRRHIHKHGIETRLSRRPEDFEDFYFNMYVPMVKRRHEELAVIHDHDDLKKKFMTKDFELLLLIKEGRTIGGSMLDFVEKKGHLSYVGIAEGDYKTIGLPALIFYFSMLRIKERGSPVANLGHCRPFLNDGTMYFKRQLGGYIAPAYHEESGWLKLFFLKKSPGLKNFLANNPFVSVEKGKYYVHRFPEKLPLELHSF